LRDERRFFLAGDDDVGAVAAAACEVRAGLDRRAGREGLSRDGDAFFGVGASAYGLSWGGRGNWLNRWLLNEDGRQGQSVTGT
jgi:hypothetical protein